MFFTATLIAFLLRVRPDSRQRKPICMLNTRPAHKTNHRTSIIEMGIGDTCSIWKLAL